MATYVDKTALTASHLPLDDVEVPGVGTVRVRGLSRTEALNMNTDVDRLELECAMLVLAMVEPAMTEDDVRAWQAASEPGEMTVVTDKVMEMSGMAPDSAKQAVKDFEANPATEFRALPSAETGDDGSGPAGGDVG